jgi:hypothetical protein
VIQAGWIEYRRPGKNNCLRFGTWNVLTLYKSGALRNVINAAVEYGIQVLAVQEVRWTGSGVLDRREYTFYCSGHSKTHQFGTGFLVSRKIIHLVIDYVPINMRLCKIRIRGRFHNYSLVSAHVPTEDKDPSEKDKFYDLLEKEYDKCPKHDIKVIFGDFNAKVGREESFKPVIRNESLHDVSNDNGLRLITFATSVGMVIGSTMFPHKQIHKATWKSPDGNTQNQIDHILIDSIHKNRF